MLPTLLFLETATEVCSVALSKKNKIVASICSNKDNSHAENLFSYIDEVLFKSQCKISEMDGIVFGVGPGSYTGLRIGASAAKGICYALNIPLIGISTLKNIVLGAKSQLNNEQKALFCPMIDARRMEVFTALFDENGEIISEIESKVIDDSFLSTELENNIIYFCGNGMPKCQSILQHPHARFIDTPLVANNMLLPALIKYKNNQFENVAYFEPFYLKEYIAKKTSVKGL